MHKKHNGNDAVFLELWRVFTSHIALILLVAVMCAAAMFAYSNFIIGPIYESSATLRVTDCDTETGSSEQPRSGDDYSNIIKGRSVLDKAIDELELDMTRAELEACISVSSPPDTRTIKISVKTDSAVKSKRIAQSVSQLLRKE